LISRPTSVFEEIADGSPSAPAVFLGSSLWLGLAPPVFAYVGTSRFGWNIGGGEPIFLSTQELLSISLAYFAALLSGFVSAALVSQWMASTYGAQRSLGVHFALMTVVGTPLAFGSVVHLYPHAIINLLVLVPMLIWSLYLLYWGLPIALKTNRERGMLMASSLVAFLLVSAVSLLGLTVVLWTYGFGPRIWI
jgi:Yip1 domain